MNKFTRKNKKKSGQEAGTEHPMDEEEQPSTSVSDNSGNNFF